MWLATINAKMSLYDRGSDPSDLIVYADLGSQPCRALVCFLRLAHIPFSLRLVSIRSRAHTLLPHNFSGKLPFITDRSFPLSEAHAIFAYLCATRRVADHWYPQEAQDRARCEQYLHGHHTGIRHIARYLHYARLSTLTGQPADPGVVAHYLAEATAAVATLNGWLAGKQYILGPQVSVADLAAVCELGQMQLVPGLLETTLEKHEHVKRWFEAVYGTPEVKDAHSVIEKIAAKARLLPAKL